MLKPHSNKKPGPERFYLLAVLMVVAGVSLYSLNTFFQTTGQLINQTYTSVVGSVRIADTPDCPPHCPITIIDEPELNTDETKPATTKPPVTKKPPTTTTPITGTPKTTTSKEYKLPELTVEQKLEEEKGFNPYKAVIIPKVEVKKLDNWSYELQVEQDLRDAVKEKPILTILDSDNEEQIVNAETQVRIVTNFAEELEELQRFEENTIVIGPTSDSDSDGIGDLVEMIYETNPFNADTDYDGTFDADEIDFGSNPNEDSGIDRAITVTNLNESIVDAEPFLKGVANPGENITIEAMNIATGEKFIIFEDTADESGKFAGIGQFSSGDPGSGRVLDGDYYVYSNHLTPEGSEDSREIARITVDTVSERPQVSAEIGQKVKTKLIAKIENTRDWMTTFLGSKLYQGLFASTVEQTPSDAYLDRLIGDAQPGDIIVVTWKSFILSSVVIADASQGRFEVAIPDKIPPGNHEIFVYAYNPQTNFFSSLARLIFFKS